MQWFLSTSSITRLVTKALQHHTLLGNRNIKSLYPRQVSVQEVLMRFTDARTSFWYLLSCTYLLSKTKTSIKIVIVRCEKQQSFNGSAVKI